MIVHARWAMMVVLWLWAGLALAGTKYYYYTDPQGTVLAEADAQGNIVASYDYAPYGTQVLGTPPNGPAGYTGHVNDAESGLVYMQARYYDPAIEHFLSVDPVGASPGSLFHFNRYNYASNNPIVNMDPDGRDDDVCMGNMQCISNGSSGGGSVRDSGGTGSVNVSLSSQQERVATTAKEVNRYGHYKLTSDWTFTVDPRYAYAVDESSPLTFTNKPSDNLMLRAVPAQSDVLKQHTIFYQDAFHAFNSQRLYYRDLHDITPLSIRTFTMSAHNTLLFLIEHEAVHINTHSFHNPEGEGDANFWGNEAVESYMHNGGR